jgi:asparagine synthetase A
MIKWEKIMETERRQFEKMSEQDKFIYLAIPLTKVSIE